MAIITKLPFSTGTQHAFDNLTPDPRHVYITEDTGRVYLGAMQLCNSVTSSTEGKPDESFEPTASYCITPTAIYHRNEEGRWILLANLQAAGVDTATNESSGVVQGVQDDGTWNTAGYIHIVTTPENKGQMKVNGWDKLTESSLIYRQKG